MRNLLLTIFLMMSCININAQFQKTYNVVLVEDSSEYICNVELLPSGGKMEVTRVDGQLYWRNYIIDCSVKMKALEEVMKTCKKEERPQYNVQKDWLLFRFDNLYEVADDGTITYKYIKFK